MKRELCRSTWNILLATQAFADALADLPEIGRAPLHPRTKDGHHNRKGVRFPSDLPAVRLSTTDHDSGVSTWNAIDAANHFLRPGRSPLAN
jgi:hypothetical protein